MANTSNSDKWYFTKEQLENTPSRKCGFDAYKELQYRQQAANFIQDMGQRLQVSQLCINTAIVYMHRFYVFHSFTNFPWHQMAAAALFLAAKVEEQPRKLEYVIRVANVCKNPKDRSFDINSERYLAQSQDLVFNENVLLQTLGFDVAIDHPHTYVVRCCHLVRASKDLAQTSYFMASNSLHLTTMCIQYKPTVVACFCILLACKWSNWEIPLSNEKKEWYTYVDPTVTAELLQQLTSEFLVIFENCPSRLKEKIKTKQESSSSPFEQERKPESSSLRSLEYKGDDPHKHRASRPPETTSGSHRSQEQREREYKERKEKERIAHMSGITLPHQSHHHRSERPSNDPTKMKTHSRLASSGPPFPPSSRNEPRDILREAAKDSPFGIPTIRDPTREHTKDPYAARSDKEVPKRDPLLKSNVQTDPNSLTNFSDVRQQRIDPSRSRIDPSRSASKQDIMRRYEEQKPPQVKTETDNIKKHLSSSFDKNSAYLKSSSSSTSQKVKSPFSLDSKSVPKTNSNQTNSSKPQFNGNTNGSYNRPMSQEADIKTKTEPHSIKEEIPTPPVIKRPSLFSPEQTPQHQQIPIKTEQLTKAPSLTSLTALSPISSPPSVPSMRNRNYSSGSEPELRPTMKKIDQVEGFENLMRDSTIGMAGIHSASDVILANQNQDVSAQCEVRTECISSLEDTALQSTIVNGLETNPTLIRNLLKEVATTSHLPGVATATLVKQELVEPIQSTVVVPPPEHSEKEHRHHKSKKKKEKHKHKDKNKEDKEKKKKHKDKDRERHKRKERKEEPDPLPVISEPIKIKIHKDKIQPMNELKIKIPKDKIRTEGIVESLPLPQPSSGGLKIKIPKDIITNCGTSSSSLSSLDVSLTHSSSSRKRDRDRASPYGLPPSKMSKSSHKESKQNGRHSYSKVSEKQPSSTDKFVSNDQGNSSINSNSVIEKESSKECFIVSNAQIEELKNCISVLRDIPEDKNSSLVQLPSTPKDVSSTVEMVSPTLLSPISANDESLLRCLEPPVHLSPMPLSPISPSNTPPLVQGIFEKEAGVSRSVNEDGTLKNSSRYLSTETINTTPPGLPTNIQKTNTIQLQLDDKSPTYLIDSTTSNPQTMQLPNNSLSNNEQSHIFNNKGETRNSYSSTPYKFVNNNMLVNNTPQNCRQTTAFSKQHRPNNNYEYISFNCPPYPPKGQRAPRNMNPRHIPPRYPPRTALNHPVPENTYSHLPQGHDNQMHYATASMPQMPYNAYQVAPPTMPNVNVPPPTYGLYPTYYGGYIYPEIYQQQVEAFRGIAQPPLPTDAPPSSEVPPPPPPE